MFPSEQINIVLGFFYVFSVRCMKHLEKIRFFNNLAVKSSSSETYKAFLTREEKTANLFIGRGRCYGSSLLCFKIMTDAVLVLC